MKFVSSEYIRTSGALIAPRLVYQSLLYRELVAEHEEILRHKWLESEKAGHDIGIDHAQIDWRLRHRSGWRKSRQQLQRFQT